MVRIQAYLAHFQQRIVYTWIWIQGKNRWLFRIILGLLPIAGSIIVLIATGPHGIGITDDSIAYITAARTFASGLGFGRISGTGNFKPMTHWPPVYPFLLSLFEFAGKSAEVGARWLGAFLVGINIFLVGWIVNRITRSRPLTLMGASFMLISPVVTITSLYAMTEPLYITLCLITFLLMDRLLEKNEPRLIFPLGLVVAIAILTRYVGAALILTCGLGILLFGSKPFLTRLKWIMLLGVITFIPLGMWLIRNYLLTGAMTNRTMDYQGIPFSEFISLRRSIRNWLMPKSQLLHLDLIKIGLQLVFAGIFLVGTRIARKRAKSSAHVSPMVWVMGIAAVIYMGMILASRLYLDRLIPIYEQRILAPLYVICLILGVFLLDVIWKRLRTINRWAAGVAVMVLAFFLFSLGEYDWNSTASMIKESYQTGYGFASVIYKNIKMPRFVDDFPHNYVIYTDNIERFYYFGSHRPSTAFYDLKDPPIDAIRDNIVNYGGAIIAFFDNNPEKIQAIQAMLPEMKLYYQGGDGFILVAEK